MAENNRKVFDFGASINVAADMFRSQAMATQQTTQVANPSTAQFVPEPQFLARQELMRREEEQERALAQERARRESSPTTMTLKREEKHLEVLSLDADLAERAARELGYSKVRDRIESSKLYDVLAELELLPYNMADVEAYKKAMAKENSYRRFSTVGGSYITYATWVRTAISEFTGEIPQFVLHTALRVKKKLPGVELVVEDLRQETRMLPEPFLVAKYGDAEAYIEVWDEPSFTGKRVKELKIKKLG